MATDRWGVEIDTSSEDAVALLDQATTELVLLRGEPTTTLDRSIEADGDAPLPHLMRAAFDLFIQTEASRTAARDRLDVIRPRLASAPAREQLHAAALHAWIEGCLDIAGTTYDEAVALHPHDLLAIRLSHDLALFTGDAERLRDGVGAARRAWSIDDPLHGALDAMYAFGLEENGAYGEAERMARGALDEDASDVWATHAMAHVFEMTRRPSQGRAFLLDTSEDWRTSFFAGHNWWHVALYEIAQGQLEGALSLYDSEMAGGMSTAWFDLVNAASLLWRLSLFGIDVSARAQALVPAIEPHLDDALSIFNDLHAVMVFVLADRMDLIAPLIAANERVVAIELVGGAPTSHAVSYSMTGRDLLAGFAAFGARDLDGAVRHLEDAKEGAWSIGGSTAQRDVILQTLLVAAVRSANESLVHVLMEERTGTSGSPDDVAKDLLDANRR